MAITRLRDVQFCLRHESLPFWVDVRLRSFGDRWLAVAQIGGESELGLGRSAREALQSSLDSLGAPVVAMLIADPQLLEVTSAIRSALDAGS